VPEFLSVLVMTDGADARIVRFANLVIIAEIPKLPHAARREIMLRIIETEEDAAILAECDQRALERFQMLDAMEAQDENNVAG